MADQDPSCNFDLHTLSFYFHFLIHGGRHLADLGCVFSCYAVQPEFPHFLKHFFFNAELIVHVYRHWDIVFIPSHDLAKQIGMCFDYIRLRQ